MRPGTGLALLLLLQWGGGLGERAAATTTGANPAATTVVVTAAETFDKVFAGLAIDAVRRTDAAGREVVIAVLLEDEAERVGAYVHEVEGRCGGYFAFSNWAEAEAFVADTRVLRGLGHDFSLDIQGGYTIDNQATVLPWLAEVDEDNVFATILHLSTATPNRYHNSPHGVAAAQWIHDTWLGLADGRTDVSAELFDDCSNCGIQPSVILTIEGADLADEIVVLGGHLDSILSGVGGGGGGNPDMNAPGADDDASGIATLTEALRVMMEDGWKPRRTVQIMGYAAEEAGLRGSRAIAEAYAAQQRQVAGVLQFDMTNYSASASFDLRLLTDNSNPALQQFVRDLFDTYLAPDGLTRGTYTCGYPCSDHVSWTQNGFPAAMVFEPTYNNAIHSPSDTLATMGNSTAVSVPFVKMALAFTGELAKSLPRLTIADAAVAEGDGEPVSLDFTISMHATFSSDVSFNYTTVAGTAVPGVDYTTTSGVATIPAGQTELLIAVPVIGNLIPQPDRELQLSISDPVNATIDRGAAAGTILDDDGLVQSGLSPSSGQASGGDFLVITGDNFLPGVEVDFGAVPAADFDVVSSTSIVATTPALAAGELYPVVVSWEGTPAAGSDARFLADFLDMPRGHLFHDAVEILRRAGISGGCGGGNFCGGQAVSRSQMAVFLLSSRWGADYTPPACSGVFDDVPCPSPFADWVEALYAAGVTGGCATEPLAYCPAGAVPRQQMAVFLLAMIEGPEYQPPACSGVFADVPCSSPYAAWIEEAYARGITGGCSAAPLRYCPAEGVNRGQMAALLVAAFDIAFAW